MKYHVSKSDFNRVLVTEVLPYETPIIFSGLNFYHRLSRNCTLDPVTSSIFDNVKYSIPYSYQAHISDEKKRDLHLIHPSLQKDSVNFYEKYDLAIIDRCSKSKVSIRKPKSIAVNFYEPQLANPGYIDYSSTVEASVDGFQAQNKFFCSYFSYQEFDKLYKFYESECFLKLEEDFEYLKEFDVSKCFYNIYTHSVGWAVKSKGFSKEYGLGRLSGFENAFDSLMQKMNYNETNGIVVGPELSRVFAEIILQDIDNQAVSLAQKDGLRYGVDFEVKRYIDNFFLFTHDKKIEQQVFLIFEKVLSKYKLYVNENKSIEFSRPFLSSYGIAIFDIKKVIDVFFQDTFTHLVDLDGLDGCLIIKPARDRRLRWSFIVDEYKSILRRNDLTNGDGASLLLGGIRSRIFYFCKNRACNATLVDEKVAAQRLIDDLCKILLYVLKTSFSIRSLNLSIQTLVILNYHFKDWLPGLSDSVSVWCKRIFEDLFVGNIDGAPYLKDRSYKVQLEFGSFLVLLRQLCPDHCFPEASLVELWRHGYNQSLGEDSGFPYWLAISILYYCQVNGYNLIKRIILVDYARRLLRGRFPESASLACAFLDFSSYPGFSAKEKKLIWKCAFKNKNGKWPGEKQSSQMALYSSSKDIWFVNWSLDVNVLRELAKKELQAGY